MKKKQFDKEHACQFIWDTAEHDGSWIGDASTLAEEFGVSEEAAESVLESLCDHHVLEKIVGTYFITNWREREYEPEDDWP